MVEMITSPSNLKYLPQTTPSLHIVENLNLFPYTPQPPRNS